MEVVSPPPTPADSEVKKSVVSEKVGPKAVEPKVSKQESKTVTNSAVKKVKRRKVL